MLLVGNGRLITHDARLPLMEDGCVAIQNGLIAEVGATADLQRNYPAAQFVDAQRRIIMPGLINTHMHLYSTFARGMALKDAPPGNFLQILERLWWRLDKVLTLEDVYCQRDGAADRLHQERHYHHLRSSCQSWRGGRQFVPHCGGRAPNRCAQLSLPTRSPIAMARKSADLRASRKIGRFCSTASSRTMTMLKGLFGLHASFTLSDKTLTRSREVAGELDAGFHVHTAEGPEDLAQCRREHGKRIVQRFHDLGILGSKTIAAHCVHVDDNEIGLLQASKTNVVHNPESNMANAVGCAPVLDMMQPRREGWSGNRRLYLRHVRIAEGCEHSPQAPEHANQVPAGQSPQRCCSTKMPLSRVNASGASVGKLIPGAHADVIIVDYDPPTPMCASNISSHILFGISGRSVVTTIVNGRILMQDRKLLVIDEEEIMAKARVSAAKLWQRF